MHKDDATWLNYCYIAFALVVAYVAFKAFETLGVQFGWADKFDEWYLLSTRVASLGLGAGATYWLRADAARREFHLAAIAEVKKVTWPTWPDTKRMTVVVVVVVAIFSVILTIFDIAWSKVLQLMLP